MEDRDASGSLEDHLNQLFEALGGTWGCGLIHNRELCTLIEMLGRLEGIGHAPGVGTQGSVSREVFGGFVEHTFEFVFGKLAQDSDLLIPRDLLRLMFFVSPTQLAASVQMIRASAQWPEGTDLQGFEQMMIQIGCNWNHPFDFLLALRRLLRHDPRLLAASVPQQLADAEIELDDWSQQWSEHKVSMTPPRLPCLDRDDDLVTDPPVEVQQQLDMAFVRWQQHNSTVLEGSDLLSLADWTWSQFTLEGQQISQEQRVQQAARLLSHVDISPTGQLTFDEFASWFSGCCSRTLLKRGQRAAELEKQEQQRERERHLAELKAEKEKEKQEFAALEQKAKQRQQHRMNGWDQQRREEKAIEVQTRPNVSSIEDALAAARAKFEHLDWNSDEWLHSQQVVELGSWAIEHFGQLDDAQRQTRLEALMRKLFQNSEGVLSARVYRIYQGAL